jgi:hypothetical protein
MSKKSDKKIDPMTAIARALVLWVVGWIMARNAKKGADDEEAAPEKT